VLTFADVQAKGTHNSYHVETTPIDPWRYTHAPLDVQLQEQGVRQFELDVSFDAAIDGHRVFHVAGVDEGTTCDLLVDCLADLLAGTGADFHPLFVLLETKDPWDAAAGPHALERLAAEVREVWAEDRLLVPGDFDGAAWPPLGATRGRALFVLHDGGDRRAFYVAEQLDADAVLFPDAMGDVAEPWSAVHTMNDPFDPAIADVVALGHLVRTRADSDCVEAFAEDTGPRDQAFASGAHFVSTDFPAPVDWTSYVVEVPGGAPSRCNPLHAPAECTAEAVE
jgi:hypothetical protein